MYYTKKNPIIELNELRKLIALKNNSEKLNVTIGCTIQITKFCRGQLLNFREISPFRGRKLMNQTWQNLNWLVTECLPNLIS